MSEAQSGTHTVALSHRSESRLSAGHLSRHRGIRHRPATGLTAISPPTGWTNSATKPSRSSIPMRWISWANYTTTLAGGREPGDDRWHHAHHPRAPIATGKGVDDIVRDLGEVVKDKRVLPPCRQQGVQQGAVSHGGDRPHRGAAARTTWGKVENSHQAVGIQAVGMVHHG